MCDPTIQLENIEKYFSKRNGTEFTPQENLNYTDDSLAIMETFEVYDKITTASLNFSRDIVQVNPGIGGLTFSILDNPKVKSVTIYESNSVYRKILQNNLNEYNFKQYQLSGQFRTIPLDINLPVLIFHLHLDCRDRVKNYQQVLNDNLNKIKAAIIVSTIEKDFHKSIENYKCVVKPVTGNLFVQICQPIVKELVSDPGIPNESDIVNYNDIKEQTPRFRNRLFYRDRE